MSRRRDHDSNGSDRRPPSNRQDIPFRDAVPDIDGELALDNLDTFIIPARDEKGITQNISFHIPPYMERQIEIILRSGRFPYLNAGSVFRHSLVRHVRWLTEIRQSIPQHLFPSMEAILELCRDNEQRMRVEEVFESISKQISKHQARGDMGEALRLMNVIKMRVEKVYASAWQRRFWADFLRVHDSLMNSDGTIKTVQQLRAAGIIQSLDT